MIRKALTWTMKAMVGMSLCLSSIGFADTGDFFEVIGSGASSGTVDIRLCLNGKGPITCQNFTVTRETLTIRTLVPGRAYPIAGIKILTPGHSPSGCIMYFPTGYCIFAVSDTASAIITMGSTQALPTLTAITPSSGPASGGTGFTLTGTNLTGPADVTFGGSFASSVTVVNATTVTGVTPSQSTGPVDVVITTPAGSATLTNGYTYVTTAVGQSSNGGTIACLGFSNLIAATVDNSTGILWAASAISVETGASSDTDGATNTETIVNCLTNGTGLPGCPGSIDIHTYAAGLCSTYEVDSQGHTPCQSGNLCYDDWFLPAGHNTSPTGQLNCLYTNQVAIGGFSLSSYWSSTEVDTSTVWVQDFDAGFEFGYTKNDFLPVRCVRTFTP